MKKLLIIAAMGLLFTSSLSAEIVFRVICEKPQGKNISKSTSKFDGKVNFDKFIDDGFFDNDLIELIYDNNQPKQIQRIWGKDNEKINLSASNKDFYHWRRFDTTSANGFNWGHWSFSLPDLMLIFTSGANYNDGLGSGISSTTMYSKCKRIN